MRYLHTMVRVSDIERSLDFYCTKLGLREVRRHENWQGRYTLVFVIAPETPDAPIELTYNWDAEAYGGGRNFGHLAFEVDNIYDFCARLMEQGVTIHRPPRDGRMAFVNRPTASRSSCSTRAARCRRRSRGTACRTSAPGEPAINS